MTLRTTNMLYTEYQYTPLYRTWNIQNKFKREERGKKEVVNGYIQINMRAPLLFWIVFVLVLLLLMSTTTSLRGDNQSKLRKIDWPCYNPCSDDCIKKYKGCAPKKFLYHCFEVCRLLCSS